MALEGLQRVPEGLGQEPDVEGEGERVDDREDEEGVALNRRDEVGEGEGHEQVAEAALSALPPSLALLRVLVILVRIWITWLARSPLAWSPSSLEGASNPPPMVGVNVRNGRSILLSEQGLDCLTRVSLIVLDSEHAAAATTTAPVGSGRLGAHGGQQQQPLPHPGPRARAGQSVREFHWAYPLPAAGTARRPRRGPGPAHDAKPAYRSVRAPHMVLPPSMITVRPLGGASAPMNPGRKACVEVTGIHPVESPPDRQLNGSTSPSRPRASSSATARSVACP